MILEDIKLLGLTPDFYTHTSDHFDRLISMAEELIKKGTVYVDDTEPELMKEEREQRVDSKNRSNCKYKGHSIIFKYYAVRGRIWNIVNYFARCSDNAFYDSPCGLGMIDSLSVPRGSSVPYFPDGTM